MLVQRHVVAGGTNENENGIGSHGRGPRGSFQDEFIEML